MKKYLIFTIAAVVSALGAWGKPAVRVPITVVQPDGSRLTVLKRGDERCHRIFTADGYLLKRDAERGYVYAITADDGSIVASDVQARNVAERTESELGFLKTPSVQNTREALKKLNNDARQSGRFTLPAKLPAFAGNVASDTRGPGLYDYSFPCKGNQKALVILVEFKDVKFNSKNKSPYNTHDTKTYFTEMLNKQGFNTYKGTGSARDWFVDNSNGQFTPDFDVFGPVTLTQNVKYYGQNSGAYDEDIRPHQMVIDACKALDSQINYKDYDRDGDGYVDNVYVFYAGYGEADTEGQENTIWPHSWEISSANAPNDYTSGTPLTLDGVKIDRYACSNETMGIVGTNASGTAYVYGNRPDGIGTFVHEFSHVMGLPDLYPTTNDYDSYKDYPFSPEEFSVMDYGPYNNDGLTPPNYSAYERYAFDWLTPEEMTPGTKSLETIGTSNKAFIVKTDKEQEFFLFENRQLTGWDKYLPGHGMLVWHVDFDTQVFYDNEVNNTKNHQYVDLVEADNILDYPTGEDYWGYYDWPESTRTGDPFPGAKNVTAFGAKTTPALVSWSKKSPGVELTGIRETSGVISFLATVNGDDGSGVNEIGADGSLANGTVYDLNGVKVGVVAEGEMPALAPGIYIVKSENSVKKIAVK